MDRTPSDADSPREALAAHFEQEAREFIRISARLLGICPSHDRPDDCHCRQRASRHCNTRLAETLESIVHFCEQHFAHEEHLMREAGLQRRDPALWWAHARDHADFMARLHEIVDVIEHAPAFRSIADLVGLFERFWLDHSLDHDRVVLRVLDAA